MFQRQLLLFLLTLTMLVGFAPARIGQFDNNQDVGNPKLAGSARYNAAKKEYFLKGSGYNIWFERDEFQFLFKKVTGDFTASADFELLEKGKDPHRKVGWMVRESLGDDASHISAVSHGDGLTVLQWRIAKGEKMRDPEDEIFSKEKSFQTIQIERKGKNYTMKAGRKGEKLQVIGSHSMEKMPDHAFLGIFICSHNPAVIEEARVWNVKISQ